MNRERDNREKLNSLNELTGLVQRLVNRNVLIDLRNETSVAGTVIHVDGYMNISLENVVYIDQKGKQFLMDNFMIYPKYLRCIHLPQERLAISFPPAAQSTVSWTSMKSSVKLLGSGVGRLVAATRRASCSHSEASVVATLRSTAKATTVNQRCQQYQPPVHRSTVAQISRERVNCQVASCQTVGGATTLRQLPLFKRPLQQQPPDQYRSSIHGGVAFFSIASRRFYSRYSATRIMTGTDTFSFADYDCVGFDLDNTLLRYRIGNMMELEYEIVSRFLVEQRGYDGRHLLKPLDKDFLQRGLIIDFERGNILKLDPDGVIRQATHGTKRMADEEIRAYYGDDQRWEVTNEYCRNMLVAWNGPLSERIRTVLDYFDICGTLLFGRIIDTLDEDAHERIGRYNVWPDVLDGLVYMYSRDHFGSNIGGYFEALKANPERYLQKASPELLTWLRELKKHKTTYLITGSHIDFANFTASYAFGQEWPELFDVIVGFAKKPGFFTAAKPFVRLEGHTETEPLTAGQLERYGVYTQGNWRDLTVLLGKIAHTASGTSPRMLYVGDNLIQDVYTPNKYTTADTVAIVEEMAAEGMRDCDAAHPDAPYIVSKFWGSYFTTRAGPGTEDASLWASLIKQHAKICIPSMDEVAKYPLDHCYNCFTENVTCNGYYPAEPLKLVNN
ncbi:5'-nucleotidase domain-containing protein 1 [Anopheles darlingi]|uniref:5'-nucleotidase domain-containing protein 1 n=1 Tax=Anopheles darlingi TaxID=43151 RepID=W5J5Q6_ANODA|nr:5'-nucleotidase domain-containing protein 1 [Anopheles darlingi]